MSDPSTFNIGREAIFSADTPEAVLAIIECIPNKVDPGRIPDALDRLEELGYPKISQLLVEKSLTTDDRSGFFFRSELAKRLESDTCSRQQVLEVFVDSLDTGSEQRQIKSAMAAIAIGYRSERLERVLLSIVGQGDFSTELTPLAVWALVYLGAQKHRQLIEPAIRESLKPGPFVKYGLLCAEHWPDFEHIPRLKQVIEKQLERSDEASFTNTVRGVQALGRLAKSFPDRSSAVFDVVYPFVDELRGWVIDNLSNEVDDARFILLDFKLLSELGEKRSPSYFYGRLLKLRQPSQVESVLSAHERMTEPLKSEFLEQLHRDAILDTKSATRSVSVQDHTKELAWEVALQFGLVRSLDWLEEAFSETNPWTLAKTIRLAGYLGQHSLVPQMRELISNDASELPTVLGIATLESLGCIATPESLDALLSSEFSLSGSVPQVQSEAIARITKVTGDVTLLLEHLLSLSGLENSATAISFAIRQLLAWDFQFEESHRHMLFSLLRLPKSKLTDVQRAYLVSSAGFTQPDQDIQILITEIAENQPPGLLAHSALECLARWRQLTPELLQRHFAECSESPLVRVAHALGVAYTHSPGPFQDLIQQVLRTGSYQTAYQVLKMMDAHEKHAVEVIEAVRYRARQKCAGIKLETEPIRVLAQIGTTHFFEFVEELDFSVLHPMVRGAILVASASLVFSSIAGEHWSKAIELLAEFVVDPDRDLRRKASRLLCQAESLDGHVFRLLESKEPLILERVIDSILWVREDSDFSLFYMTVSSHRERRIRQLARLIQDERYEHNLANYYLPRLLSLSSPLIERWRYGLALEKVGHEGTVEKLFGASAESERPLNERSYLADLATKIEKSAEKRRAQRYREYQD